MQSGHLQALFPWGLLLVTDDSSSDEIPPWASDADVVTATPTAVVVRVVHEQEGTAEVVVREGESQDMGLIVFDGVIEVPSGRLRVGDALNDQKLIVSVQPGPHLLRVSVNRPVEASEVSIEIDPV